MAEVRPLLVLLPILSSLFPSSQYGQFKASLAEILTLLYRDQSASTLMDCIAETQEAEKDKRLAKLEALQDKELVYQQKFLQHARRHVRFGGFYEVPTLNNGQNVEHRVSY